MEAAPTGATSGNEAIMDKIWLRNPLTIPLYRLGPFRGLSPDVIGERQHVDLHLRRREPAEVAHGHSAGYEGLNYDYDFLDRLTNMTINGLPGASYAYDPAVTFGGKIGNMTSKTEGGVTLNFTYSAQHVHGSTYTTYDRNGNASQSSGDIYSFDAENRLAQMNTWAGMYPMFTNYAYDAAGQMSRRNTQNAIYPGAYDQKDTFVGGIYQERSTACGAAESYTKYYVALGRVIAQRTGTIAGGVPDAGTLTNLLADHLVAVVGSAEYDSYLDILLITRVRSSHTSHPSGSG